MGILPTKFKGRSLSTVRSQDIVTEDDFKFFRKFNAKRLGVMRKKTLSKILTYELLELAKKSNQNISFEHTDLSKNKQQVVVGVNGQVYFKGSEISIADFIKKIDIEKTLVSKGFIRVLLESTSTWFNSFIEGKVNNYVNGRKTETKLAHLVRATIKIRGMVTSLKDFLK